jgi:hypothetical protein
MGERDRSELTGFMSPGSPVTEWKYGLWRHFMAKDSTRPGILIIVTALMVVCLILVPAITSALMSFASLGVDQKTMQVVEPARLKAMGMKDVRRGDTISIDGTRDKRFAIVNRRTGETLIYPEKAADVKKPRQ